MKKMFILSDAAGKSYIGKFKSIRDARYFLGLKSNGNISRVLSGRKNSTHGYYFKYISPELLEEQHDTRTD